MWIGHRIIICIPPCIIEASRNRATQLQEFRLQGRDTPAIREGMLTSSTLLGKQPGDRSIFVIDSHCMFRVAATRSMSSVYAIPVVTKEMAAMFCDAIMDITIGTVTKEKVKIFNADTDVAWLFDGRSSSNYSKLDSAIKKGTKIRVDDFFTRPTGAFRMHYTNSEFEEGGCMRCPGIKYSPHSFFFYREPMESVVVCYGKTCTLENRNRILIDIPGSLSQRGFARVPLVPSPETGHRAELAPLVTPSHAEKLLKELPLQGDEDLDELPLGGLPAIDGPPAAVGPPAIDGPPAIVGPPDAALDQPKLRRLFGLALPEVVWREFINLFQPKQLVFLNADFGASLVACARHNVQGLFFVPNEGFKLYMIEYATATILSEQLDGIADGFLVKRFINRKRSLNGDRDLPGLLFNGSERSIPPAGQNSDTSEEIRIHGFGPGSAFEGAGGPENKAPSSPGVHTTANTDDLLAGEGLQDDIADPDIDANDD
jgi:hypothetical protein